MELSDISFNALSRYFNSLTHMGYIKDTNVFKLLVLLYLEEVINNEEFNFITNEDYNIIYNTLYCLSENNCLIDIPISMNSNSLINKTQQDKIRVTEDYIFRVAEFNGIRLAN